MREKKQHFFLNIEHLLCARHYLRGKSPFPLKSYFLWEETEANEINKIGSLLGLSAKGRIIKAEKMNMNYWVERKTGCNFK